MGRGLEPPTWPGASSPRTAAGAEGEVGAGKGLAERQDPLVAGHLGVLAGDL